jgi:hypothetical protein
MDASGHSPDRRKGDYPLNARNLLLASIVGGLVSTILCNVPILNLVNVLLCAGFWAGPLLAVWLYRRQSGSLSFGQGLGVGVLAGVWAGVFGFVLSLVGLAGAEALMRSYAQFASPDSGFDAPAAGAASVLFNLAGVAFNIVFGAIGGLIGGALFKTRRPSPTPAV